MNRRKLLKVGMGATALSVLPVRAFAQDVVPAAVEAGAAAASMIPARSFAQDATPPVAADDPNALLVGTAIDLIPEGEPDEVSIVLQSGVIDASIAVVIRNNTSEAVEVDEIIGSIRDSAGTLIGKTGFSEVAPMRIEPNGGIALGRVYLGDENLPLDADVQLAVKLREWELGYVSLPIVELEQTVDGFVGAVENPSNHSDLSFIEIVGVSLDPTGTPIGFFHTYAEVEDLDLLGVAYFDTKYSYQGQLSDQYLVAASAW